MRVRVVPCLLLSGAGLVKTVRFSKPRYVGDPVNTVRLFNDKEADELILLDIQATTRASEPNIQAVGGIAGECFMPLCYGGGVRTVLQMERLFESGVEKVAINTAAYENPTLVDGGARRFGSQAIVVGIDVKRRWAGRFEVVVRGGRFGTGLDPVAYARRVEDEGAGEILLTAVDRDGTMSGYDLDLVERVSHAVSIPVIACGGAGSLSHLSEALASGASAVAAGSLFVFTGKHQAVLVTYPSPSELESLGRA